MRNAYKILVRKHEEKKPLGRPRHAPSWCGAQLKKRHRDSFTLTFTLLI
jgi:hypothetical protein